MALMVDENSGQRFYWSCALELLIEHVKARPNAQELFLSHVPGTGSPENFYRKLGFEHTGEQAGEELVMKLTLQ